MINVQRILYPTDFSSYSNQAYFHAVALAEHHRATLTALYVYNPAAAAGEEADRGHWQEQLEQIRPVDSRIAIRHIMLDGDPAAEIVRFATANGIDMIVMGTHGRTGLDRLLMGSVAEKVMRDAPCSVMVVKLPRRASADARQTVAGKVLS